MEDSNSIWIDDNAEIDSGFLHDNNDIIDEPEADDSVPEINQPIITLQDIASVMGITIDKAEQMVNNYGSIASAYEEACTYFELRNKTTFIESSVEYENLTELIADGSGAVRTVICFLASGILRSSLNDVMIGYDEIDTLLDYDDEINYLAITYYISPAFAENYCTSNDLSHEELMHFIDDYFTSLYPDVDETFVSLLSGSTNDGMIPFEYKVNEEEKISVFSGELEFNKLLAAIPGINGMDMDISLMYNSESSDTHGTAVYSTYESQYNGIYADVTSVTYNSYNWNDKSPFLIGSGWRLGFDYIDIYHDRKELIQFDKNKNATYNQNLYQYNPSICSDNGTYPGSVYKVSFPNGLTEYFDVNGDIVARVDRFGNAITFVTTIGSSPYIKRLTISNGVTSVIIDSGLLSTKITFPDGNEVVLNCEASNSEYILTSVVEPDYGTTTYQYSPSSYSSPTVYDSYSNGYVIKTYQSTCHYHVMRVTYPTGLKAVYSFSGSKISNRKNIDNANNDFNSVSYFYYTAPIEVDRIIIQLNI